MKKKQKTNKKVHVVERIKNSTEALVEHRYESHQRHINALLQTSFLTTGSRRSLFEAMHFEKSTLELGYSVKGILSADNRLKNVLVSQPERGEKAQEENSVRQVFGELYKNTKGLYSMIPLNLIKYYQYDRMYDKVYCLDKSRNMFGTVEHYDYETGEVYFSYKAMYGSEFKRFPNHCDIRNAEFFCDLKDFRNYVKKVESKFAKEKLENILKWW